MTGEYFCRGIVSMRSWIIYCFNVIEFNDLVLVVKSVVGRLRSCLPYTALRFCSGRKVCYGRLRSYMYMGTYLCESPFLVLNR